MITVMLNHNELNGDSDDDEDDDGVDDDDDDDDDDYATAYL